MECSALPPPKRQKISDDDTIKHQCRDLVSDLASACSSADGCGSFSVTVYDSAWLSMVAKEVDGNKEWLFPECLAYVLDSQQPDGSWASYRSQVDGILNTAAALLALLTHRNSSVCGHLSGPNHQDRIVRAESALRKLLASWDVANTVHVGFEILVPKMLQLLKEQGVTMEFSGETLLTQEYEQKMAKFHPKMVYASQQTTILHSLEGLVGQIDFDRVKHHVSPNHGIMGSPSSTAAYLSNCSEWDERAEEYLKKVFKAYGSTGGIPSAFPTPIFEVTWSITVLHASGILSKIMNEPPTSTLRIYLRDTLKQHGGITGFAPGLLADADDTAKAIASLQCLGDNPDLGAMVEAFETKTHFRTYNLERNPSFSANCNILAAFLDPRQVRSYVPQVEKAIRFLLDIWSDGKINDKWNLASEYSQMSMACALVTVIERWNDGLLTSIDEELVLTSIPLILSQILSQVLRGQSRDGSWGDCVETSAYCVILLARLLTLPWSGNISQAIQLAAQNGRDYLTSRRTSWNKPNYIWVEKVTYGSPVLSKLYCLAAMGTDHESRSDWLPKVESAFSMANAQSSKMVKFFSKLPLFREISSELLEVAQLEAMYYGQRLRQRRLTIFSDRDATMTKDKYLAYIPFAWTSCNLLAKTPLPGKTLWEMMVVSLLNYQADEFMETSVANLPPSDFEAVESILQASCGSSRRSSYQRVSKGGDSPQEYPSPQDTPPWSDSCDDQDENSQLKEVSKTIYAFTSYILNHEAVIRSPSPTQHRLAEELYAFLRAHCLHNRDNQALRSTNTTTTDTTTKAQQGAQFRPEQDYYSWVRSTGADDTSCPYSFVFFSCLISAPGCHALASVEQSYYGQALCRSLATMCRQYNDYGSWARDRQEGNLNSLNFPGFEAGGAAADDTVEDSLSRTKPQSADAGADAAAKQRLMNIAEFERECMLTALRRLEGVTPQNTCDALKTFINVTDLFGQIYVMKDIASQNISRLST